MHTWVRASIHLQAQRRRRFRFQPQEIGHRHGERVGDAARQRGDVQAQRGQRVLDDGRAQICVLARALRRLEAPSVLERAAGTAVRR